MKYWERHHETFTKKLENVNIHKVCKKILQLNIVG